MLGVVAMQLAAGLQVLRQHAQPLHALGGRRQVVVQVLRLAVDQVHFYNRFVTPLGRPRRFDTRFFIAAAPETQRGQHDEKETVDSIWITPQEALARHKDKEFDLMNVTRIQLEWLSEYPDKQALLDMALAQQEFLVRRPIIPVG